MEPQPELYVVGVLAIVGIALMDAAKPKKQERIHRRSVAFSSVHQHSSAFISVH